MNQFQVTIEQNEEGLGKELGITEDRAEIIIDFLAKATLKSREENILVSNLLKEVSGVAENANELAFICFSIGAFFEKNRMSNPLDMILETIFKSSTQKTN